MFFGEEERASPEVIDAMTRTANKFSARWEFSSPPDAKWIHLWSNFVGDMTPDEIDRAADHFVKAFRSPPMIGDFTEAKIRMRAGRSLDEPFVSAAERIAYMILTTDEFTGSGVSFNDLSTACLIAAVVANMKAHEGLVPDEGLQVLNEILSGTLSQIGDMSKDWIDDAREGKGYWASVFGKGRPAPEALS